MSEQNINLDKIVEEIKKEVSRTKDINVKAMNKAFHQKKAKSLKTTANRIVSRVAKSRFYKVLKPFAPIASRFLLHLNKPYIHVKELLINYDSEFVQDAYNYILNREPDTEALQNATNALRNGNVTRIHLLKSLHRSAEGRKISLKIHGLTLYSLFNSTSRFFMKIPVLNTFFFSYSINNVNREIKYAYKKIAVLNENAANLNKDLNEAVRQLDEDINENARIIDERTLIIEEFLKKLDMVPAGERNYLDKLYVAFEEKFRGSQDLVLSRQNFYLDVLKSAYADKKLHVLDIGCGRGEWLELLNKNGYITTGIEMNKEMYRICRGKGLIVIESDANVYLKQLKDNCLEVITAFHVVEHLVFSDLMDLFRNSYRVLKVGGCILFETPNPENILVGCNTFYTDPSHHNPIPPQTLEFLAGYAGFSKVEIIRQNPLNYTDPGTEKAVMDIAYRVNMEQDYYIKAVKTF